MGKTTGMKNSDRKKPMALSVRLSRMARPSARRGLHGYHNRGEGEVVQQGPQERAGQVRVGEQPSVLLQPEEAGRQRGAEPHIVEGQHNGVAERHTDEGDQAGDGRARTSAVRAPSSRFSASGASRDRRDGGAVARPAASGLRGLSDVTVRVLFPARAGTRSPGSPPADVCYGILYPGCRRSPGRWPARPWSGRLLGSAPPKTRVQCLAEL